MSMDSTTRAPRGSSRVLTLLRPTAHAVFACILSLSSMYCALAYIPSTYFAFIQAPFQGWLAAFAHLQGYLFAVAFAGVAITLVAEHRKSLARRLVLEFVACGIVASGYLIWARPVQTIGNNTASFVWAIAFLMPVLWVGAINYHAYLPQLRSDGDRPRWIACGRVITTAAFVGVLCPGAAYLRYFASGMMSRLPQGEMFVWTWAAITHVLLFLFAFSAIDLTTRLANRSANPRRARFVLFTWLSWLAISVAIYKVVLASVPFQDAEAQVYAAMLGMAGVTFVGGWVLRLRLLQGGVASAESDAKATTDRRQFAALVFFLIAASVTVPALIGAMDWNSVLEKAWSLAYWTMAAAVFVYRRPATQQRWAAWAVGLLAVVSLLAYRLGVKSEDKWAGVLLRPGFDVTSSLERHAVFDASFGAAAMLLEPSSERYCNAHCEFVRQQTNIRPSASLNLHDINLVEKLGPKTGKKPNIFIIVVDSLRRDYVSAYNPDVSFTPAIGAFAKDSVVFRNAFSRYSGTTLAEPSIWSGTLQLHKHYVQPFHLVNNLEKLAQVDGYQSFVTVDTVLRVLLQPQPDLVKLDDVAEKWTDVDFCATAVDAISKIDGERDRQKPIFLYTQPQNIHLVTLSKTLATRPPRKKYGAFVDGYASELERLDGCFGNFVEALKTRGLYEDSIIVLTSDHGEALREAGAQRHGFSLKPEVMRIPLIVHAPPEIEREWYHDSDAVAFNTDVTPSLYELLGHGPVIARPEFGRPLFVRTRDEMQKYFQDSYIIASSYGPIYGLLYDHGKELFLEDEASGVEQWFDSNVEGPAMHDVLTEELRRKGEAQVRADLQGIAHLYGYKYKPLTILDWLMR